MSRPSAASPRHGGALVVGGAVATLAAIVLLSSGFLASACTESIAQPDDAGSFPMFDGGHPPPSMYGSPCEIDVYQPEPCCGQVAKVVPGRECYGCGGRVAYALCVGGGFSCACTCEPPAGYLVLPAAASTDCGLSEIEASSADAPSESSAPDAPSDAPADVGDGGGA